MYTVYVQCIFMSRLEKLALTFSFRFFSGVRFCSSLVPRDFHWSFFFLVTIFFFHVPATTCLGFPFSELKFQMGSISCIQILHTPYSSSFCLRQHSRTQLQLMNPLMIVWKFECRLLIVFMRFFGTVFAIRQRPKKKLTYTHTQNHTKNQEWI